MSRRRSPTPKAAHNDIDTALAALSADALREVLREVLLELNDKAHSSLVNSLIQRAVRSGSGWAPTAVSGDEVAEALAFAKAAERVGRADPSDVDDHLRRASGAFLRKDYSAAHRIFGALLRPIGDGEIVAGSVRRAASRACGSAPRRRSRRARSKRLDSAFLHVLQARWVAAIRTEHKRFPALRAELDRTSGAR